MNEYRTHNCGELRMANIGQTVKVAGWVQRIRNLGGMKFIDLRDQFGITQIIISENEELQEQAKDLVTECVISVTRPSTSSKIAVSFLTFASVKRRFIYSYNGSICFEMS